MARPKGSRNRKTIVAMDKIESLSKMVVDVFEEALRSPERSERMEAAKAVAPFIFTRKKDVTLSGGDGEAIVFNVTMTK